LADRDPPAIDTRTTSRLEVEQAVGTFEAPLTRYALHLVGDLETAREVVQETFMAMWLARRADLTGNWAPWLYAVCRNRAVDRLRKEHRMDTLDEPIGLEVEAPDPQPGARAEVLDDHRRVLAAIRALPARQREVLELKVQADLSYREISQVTGLTESNVGFLLHTAIRTVRDRLAVAEPGLKSTPTGARP
jgi:RNA polymerase sigma-70 factor (ECF subfamily)